MSCGLIGMYWVKCKQSNCHTSITTLCSHFCCLTVIRPWLNLATDGHGHVIFMDNLWRVFSRENTPECCTEANKSSFLPYKHVSGRNGDHEWRRMTNAFILCDLLWKVQKGHAANIEGSFNLSWFLPLLLYICFQKSHLVYFIFHNALLVYVYLQ